MPVQVVAHELDLAHVRVTCPPSGKDEKLQEERPFTIDE